MPIINRERVNQYFELDEANKRQRSPGTKEIHPDKSFNLFHLWVEMTIPSAMLGLLETFVSADKNDGNYHIWKQLGTTDVQSVVDNLDRLRASDDPVITEWLKPCDDSLGEYILSGESYPPTLRFPATTKSGDIGTGVHRIYKAAELAKEGKLPDGLRVVVGIMDPFSFIAYTAHEFVHGFDLTVPERLSLIVARQRSIIRTAPILALAMNEVCSDLWSRLWPAK